LDRFFAVLARGGAAVTVIHELVKFGLVLGFAQPL